MRTGRASDENSRHEAEVLALRALAFVLADDRRAGRFRSLTGFDPTCLGAATIDASVHEGVLDFLLGDEPMLIEFCDWAGIDPAAPGAALRTMSGTRDAD